MGGITTHVLDVSIGKPAAGVLVTLECKDDGHWEFVGRQKTDIDGRARDLISPEYSVSEGLYRLTFGVGPYFANIGVDGFYDDITIAFIVHNRSQHYHVPLLLSPFGYSTYRGS